jgi:hypothetical protein
MLAHDAAFGRTSSAAISKRPRARPPGPSWRGRETSRSIVRIDCARQQRAQLTRRCGSGAPRVSRADAARSRTRTSCTPGRCIRSATSAARTTIPSSPRFSSAR